MAVAAGFVASEDCVPHIGGNLASSGYCKPIIRYSKQAKTAVCDQANGCIRTTPRCFAEGKAPFVGEIVAKKWQRDEIA